MDVSKSLSKIENLYKRAQRLMLEDNSSSYEREKSDKYSMDFKRKHRQCNELYKTLVSNPTFMTETFELRSCYSPVRQQYKSNLDIPRKTQVGFANKILRGLGPKI